MKNQCFLLLNTLLFFGISTHSYGQATDNADVDATVVTPISISKNSDINFGNLAVSATAGGIVYLQSWSGLRTKIGGVTFPAQQGTVSFGNFTISGEPNYTFSIVASGSPMSLYRNGDSGSPDIIVMNGTNTEPNGSGTLDGSGSATVILGASIVVSAGETPGVYTNSGTSLLLTVNYN